MILHPVLGKRVRATGPSLTAILRDLGWSLAEVVCTQLSNQGTDVVMVVEYTDAPDSSWIDA